jgi:ribosomal protein L21E
MFAEDVLMAKLKVGDRVKIPVHKVFHAEAGHVGKVVYISADGKTVTVKCDRKHNGKTVAFNVALESISE